MELVYLWVEDYKNIQKQGFNFSPRFECKYDDETNELSINENDDYIENFFGENINVTAIVGKNGSGKSSVLEILDSLNISQNYRYIFKKNNTFYIGFDEYRIISNIEEEYNFERMFYIEQNLDEENVISSSLLNCNDSDPINCKTLTIASVLENDNHSFNFIDEKFIFRYWKVEINKSLPNLDTGLQSLDERYTLYTQIVENGINYLHIFSYVTIKLIQYILAKKSLEQSKYWTLLNNLNENFTEENYLNLVNEIDLERFDNTGNYNLILNTLQQYQESVDFIESFLSKREISSNEIKSFIDSGVYKTFYGFSSNNFQYNIIGINYLTDSDLKFLDLSSGEQQRISNVALFLDYMNSDEDISLLLSLIDEPDTYLHPKWQKGLIDDYMQSSITYQRNIHIIITTHSPFLLSDLPKQNIIFLDTDEEGKCQVVNGLKEKKQTFGANIHTLLSDSFFMEDGLMGEFAKGKINEIIDFHKVVEKEKHTTCLKKIYEKRKTKFWQTQSIIGEEYLKQIIKNHLVEIEKILLGKDEAKKQEIERTETYLKSLKND